MKNPARKKFEPMLSPYVDGELSPEERQQVEQHLQANKESADQVADFRALSGLIRHTMDQAADEIDWKQFTNDVMGRVVPEKLPLFERIKISLVETFTWQRGPLFTGAALATAAAVVAVVGFNSGGRVGYAQENLAVQTVTVEDEARVQPVVMQTKGGDSIIWVVEEPPSEDAKDGEPGADAVKKKKTGEESEELGIDPARPAEEKKAGEL
jgi:anti-sigma factor RsiW